MNDFYITEATEFPEGSFESVARRILKTQRKLGALKGLSVSTMSLADSRKDRLKKAGLFSVAVITGAALAGAGVHTAKNSKVKLPKVKLPKVKLPKVKMPKAKLPKVKMPKFGKRKVTKEDFLDEDYLTEAILKNRAERIAHQIRRERKAERLAREGSNLPAVIPNVKNKKRSINGKLVGAGLAAAGAAGTAGYVASKKQTVVIEAKYAYGTKLFQVYNATQAEIEENVDKAILKVLSLTVASLKSATDWTVKESVSEAFIQRAALSEMLIEEALTSQLEEDALFEEYDAYIYEDEEEEDLAEAYYFEEDEDEDDDEEDELAEAYIFEDDEEEDDEEEDDEDLAEAYYFED